MWLDTSIYIVLLALFFFVPPLYDGIERKIRARLHSRVGPPSIMQTWYDIRKLFNKELVATDTGMSSILVATIFVVVTLLVALILPLGYTCLFSSDPVGLVLFTVMLISSQLLWITLSLTPGNPFSTIGVYREAILGMVNEFFFAVGLVALMAYTRSLSFTRLKIAGITLTYILLVILLAIAAYVASGRIPFDIAEAEPELASGVLIEFSGPVLGLVLYSHFLKRAILYGLVIDLILLPLTGIFGWVVGAVLFFPLLLCLWMIYAVLSIVLSRSRIDVAPRTMFAVYLVLSIIILVAWILGV